MNRHLIEKMTRLGAEAQRRDERKKRAAARRAEKEAHLSEKLKCALCGKMVERRVTAMTPIGPACKSHPGVQ
tara:strand:+ start:1171 stop:1386 length:216 start_codon:yes stop_codon:yes gene_type:complete